MREVERGRADTARRGGIGGVKRRRSQRRRRLSTSEGDAVFTRFDYFDSREASASTGSEGIDGGSG